MWGPNSPKRLVYLDIFGPHFEVAEIAFVWRHREEIKQLVHRRGHDRLQHYRNDAQDFERRVENNAHFAGIAVSLFPWLASCEIAIGPRDNFENASDVLVYRKSGHVLAGSFN